MKNRTDSRQNRNIKDAKKKTTDKDNQMMNRIQKSANQWWQNKREKNPEKIILTHNSLVTETFVIDHKEKVFLFNHKIVCY